MRPDTVVELTVDRGLRVCCAGKYAAAINSRATSACIVHPKGRIFHQQETVYSSFDNDDKVAVVIPEGILFTMNRQNGKFSISLAFI